MGAHWHGKGRNRKVRIQWKDERGIWKRETTACATISEGREKARERQQEADDLRDGKKKPPKKDITIREAVYDHYIPSLPPDYASKNSLEGRFRNRILPRVVEGKRTLGELLCRSELDGGHVKKMLALNPDCSPATRRQLLMAVQGLFTFLIQAKRASENPAAGLSVRVPKRKPKFLKTDEIPRLLEAWPLNRRLHFAFQLGVGARKGQSLDLEWPAVHEDEGYVILFGKDNEENIVPLPDWLCLLLRAERAVSTSRYVFPKPEGLRGAGAKQPRWVALHRIMKTALRRAELVDGYDARCVTRGSMKRCGYKTQEPLKVAPADQICPGCKQRTLQVLGRPIPIVFHSLRSTFATWAYAQTRDIRFVQQVLGHSDTRVTDRYAAVVMDHMRALANRVHLNPFQAGALPSGLGTPVGQAERNGVHPGAFQSSTAIAQHSGEARDADR